MNNNKRQSRSDDWLFVNNEALKMSDDNISTSDIEVISNTSCDVLNDTAISSITDTPEPPKLLYSDIVKKPPISQESDIEFVPESTDLEYDDEEYLNEVLKSTRPATSDDSEAESEADVPDPAMSVPDMDEREVVLEVNLTLLNFSIFIGISGLSGFFLGGIYSAMLTNNISTGTTLYPAALPNHLYREQVNTCPSPGCEPKLYQIEENMKQLKQTLSYDISKCHNKLRHALRENKSLRENIKSTAKNHKYHGPLKADFANIRSESATLLANLESCTNNTVVVEQRVQNAIKSKQYIESILINKINSDKEKYKSLKQMFSDQESILAEIETRKSTLEETLVRKITGNRHRFLDTKQSLEETMSTLGKTKHDAVKYVNILKSKVGKYKSQNYHALAELEKSRVVIDEYSKQLKIFESYVKQLESHLKHTHNDKVMRDAFHRQYTASKDREHRHIISSIKTHYETLLDSQVNSSGTEFSKKYNQAKFQLEVMSATLSRRTKALNNLHVKHTETSAKLEQQEESTHFWKELYKETEEDIKKAYSDLRSCLASKHTAVAEYKKTTDMLLDLLSDVASRPKVKKLMKEGGGENFSLLQHIYNTTTPDDKEKLDTCLAVVSPLFPSSVSSRTLTNVINMSQSKIMSHKLNNALQKYWGGVDKTYKKLAKSYHDHDDDDDDDDDDWFLRRHEYVHPHFYPQGPEVVRPQSRKDWYLSRKPKNSKGEYSFVNKGHKQNKKNKASYKKRNSHKGKFDCRMFDCINTISTHVGFELCGC